MRQGKRPLQVLAGAEIQLARSVEDEVVAVGGGLLDALERQLQAPAGPDGEGKTLPASSASSGVK